MKKALIYSLKVWLTALLLSPVLYWLVETNFISPLKTSFEGMIGFFGLSILYGLLLSIPSFLFLTFSCFFVNMLAQINAAKKRLITLIAFIFVILPFYLLFSRDDTSTLIKDDLPLASSYSVVIIIGVWFYQLNPIVKEPSTQSKA